VIGDWLSSSNLTPEQIRIRQQEALMFQVTELIALAMEQGKISRSKLADLLGTSRAYITQILDGNSNLTLKTLADVFTSMDRELCVGFRRPEWVETHETVSADKPTLNWSVQRWPTPTIEWAIEPTATGLAS